MCTVGFRLSGFHAASGLSPCHMGWLTISALPTQYPLSGYSPKVREAHGNYPYLRHDAPLTAKERHRRNRHNRPKYQIPSRVHLDGRTAAAKEFDRLYAAVSSDLGNDLTAVEKAVVEGFVGATVVLQSLNTQLALGQEIDLAEHSAVCSSMTSLHLGFGRHG